MTRIAAIVLSVALAVASSAAGASGGVPTPIVDVRQEDGTYRVTATFLIDETPAALNFFVHCEADV